MKKTLLLTLALLLSVTIFAQNRISYISEHFDSEEFPADWSIVGDCTPEHWSIWKTNQAGGEPNEIKLYWKPSFEGVARLVSPALNLTNVTNMVMSFKAFLDNNSGDHKMGVATTSDDGATWNLAWENYYSNSNQGKHDFVKIFSTPDMGKENVKFCIFFEGRSGNINGWYFDDIDIYTLDDLNLGLITLNVPEILGTKDNHFVFTAKNTGEEDITSFTASYQIDDNDAVVETFECNVASLETKQFSFQQGIDITPGNHKLTVSILSVNDKEDITIDNTLSTDVIVALSSVQRKPMIEHFSSSNCTACPDADNRLAVLTEKYHDKYTYTKYPFYTYPYDDPYKTLESKAKMAFYYNVNAAPTVFFNGNKYNSEISFKTFISEEDFEKSYNEPAYIELKGAFNVNETDSTIKVNLDVMPYMDLDNKRMFISVNEKTTTGNTGYNGQLEFHHVLMKMLPDVEGTELDFRAGELQHFEFTYAMDTTFVEELNDLEVAVWIQDYNTHVIYNSNYLYEYTEHPYSVQNLKLADTDNTLLITWEAPQQSNPVGYNIYINDSLIAENHKELSYSTKEANGLTFVKVAAVYENGKTSVGVIDNIVVELNTESISENTISLNIYPNPVNDKLYIVTEDEVEDVVVYDIYGRRQQLSAISGQPSVIDVADLKSGIYFIKINTNEGNIVKRIIKL